MNYIKLLCISFIVLFLIPGDNDDMDYIYANNNNDGLTYSKETISEQPGEIKGNPSRGWYQVVIIDADRWEICLNVNRRRVHVTSYGCGELFSSQSIFGHLWYKYGSFISEGPASAMYNPAEDTITIIGEDASFYEYQYYGCPNWKPGRIVYALKFTSETGTEMDGTYMYHENPWRTNRIKAWLIQGKIGQHNAGPYPGRSVPESLLNKKPSLTHTKRAQDN